MPAFPPFLPPFSPDDFDAPRSHDRVLDLLADYLGRRKGERGNKGGKKGETQFCWFRRFLHWTQCVEKGGKGGKEIMGCLECLKLFLRQLLRARNEGRFPFPLFPLLGFEEGRCASQTEVSRKVGHRQ